jgi:hypothetical protein
MITRRTLGGSRSRLKECSLIKVLVDVANYDPETVVQSDAVVCRSQSAFLTSVVDPWEEMVGWHDYQKGLGGRDRFKHYLLYFDNACSVQVVASTCEV